MTSAPISTAKEDDEGPPKLSLPTEANREAWQKSGFRLGIGLAYGEFKGLSGAPSGRLLGTQLHVGLRLDPSWSIMSTFQYASVSKKGGLAGLRFMGTIDPTWHVRPDFALALGVGFGGIVEGRSDRPDMTGSLSSDTSYTYPTASPPLPSCSGVGVAGLARGEYDLVLGAKLAMNVSVEIIGQYTKCVMTTRVVDPDTAQPIVRNQFWPHAGATLSWGLTWR